MTITVVLAVGLESSLMPTEGRFLESAGYIFIQTWSIREAIELFRGGDFDLVILGHSLPAESREQLACFIRALGSRIPVVCTTESQSERDAFADAAITSEPGEFLGEIGNFLASRPRLPEMSDRAPQQNSRVA